MTLLVSEPDRFGESNTMLYCSKHLDAALRSVPLGKGEYLVTADEDLDCDECQVDAAAAVRS